jgi:2,3-dihydroxyphenylpropionate 1,2-dioxygenase
MAEIVIGAALSHSPLMNVDVPADCVRPVDAYRRSAGALGDRLRDARPDALVVFAQDHFRTVFYNNMPAFMIGVGDVTRWGDWRGTPGPLPTDLPLARHVARGLFERGFEPALSYDIKVDHSIAQVLDLFGMTDVPVIPILVNAAAPPLPTPARCFAFGEALRGAVESFSQARRVAVIGSGGLSHAPLKVSIETEENPEARAFFIHGIKAAGTNEEDRIKGIVARVDQLAAAIRPDWDRMILERLVAGQARNLAAELDFDAIQAGGGSGAQELRSWLAMLGAAGACEVNVVHYEPVPFLVTGMGAIVARCERAGASGARN